MRHIGWVGLKIAAASAAIGLSLAAASGLASAASAAPAPGATGIEIVSAQFGDGNSSKMKDFSNQLQNNCGPSVSYCEAFCTRTFAGANNSGVRLPFSAAPICRVVYRCGSDATRATEVEAGETIVLQCRHKD